MAPRNKRYIEIMTAAGLADKELARERMKGERDARTTSAMLGALNSLVNTGIDVGGRLEADYTKGLTQDALTANRSAMGEEGEAPEVAARRLVEGNEAFQEKEAKDPFSWIGNLITRPSREKAAREARTGLTEQIIKNRDEAAQKAAAAEKAERERLLFDQGQEDRTRTIAGQKLEAMLPGVVIQLGETLSTLDGSEGADAPELLLADEADRVAKATGADPAEVAERMRAELERRALAEDARTAEEQQRKQQAALAWARLRDAREAREEAARQREFYRQQDRENRLSDMETMRQMRREDKEADRARTSEEKRKAATVEVENFTANILDNIDRLEKQIRETGTFEAFGPESSNMERRITAIATDLAKLADPGSVAREGEVAMMKKGLFPTGAGALFRSNDTALETLAELRKEVQDRRANAYRIRGLEPPEMNRSMAAQNQPPATTTEGPSASAPTLVSTRAMPDGRLDLTLSNGHHIYVPPDKIGEVLRRLSGQEG